MTRKQSHFQYSEPILEHLLRFLRFHKIYKYVGVNSKVVDIGCGYNGELLKSVESKIESGIGYDISVSREVDSKKIKLIEVDLNRKSFWGTRKNFDIAVTLAVLEHVENPRNFLLTINSLLKKDGILLITTPHLRSKKVLEFLSINLGLISNSEIADHKQYFDEDNLSEVLRKTGFKVVEISTFEFGFNIFCIAKKAS